MGRHLIGAILCALVLATLLGWTAVIGPRLLALLAIGVALAVTVTSLSWLILKHSDQAQAWLRSQLWFREAGRHHAFAGVPLTIIDDGRHVWMNGNGLLRVLGRRESDDVLAARHAGCWQRTAKGVLMLRVDAVVQVLATMPGRDDPRTQRLRRYLERDVLHPAARRRQTR